MARMVLTDKTTGIKVMELGECGECGFFSTVGYEENYPGVPELCTGWCRVMKRELEAHEFCSFWNRKRKDRGGDEYVENAFYF